MSETAQRIGIFIIAVIFLLITVLGSIFLLISNDSNNSEQLTEQEIQQLIDEQNQNQEEPVVAITCTNDSTINYTPVPPLAGTALPNFTPTDSIPELSCIDVIVGQGAEATPGATVTAHYTGAVASTGVIFQSSYDQGQPIPFSLSGVIAGWSQGVPGMKEGGKRRILIPSELAYGETPPQGSGIPASADLVFDVELVKLGE